VNAATYPEEACYLNLPAVGPAQRAVWWSRPPTRSDIPAYSIGRSPVAVRGVVPPGRGLSVSQVGARLAKRADNPPKTAPAVALMPSMARDFTAISIW